MIQDLRKYTDSFLFKLLLGFISVTFVISFGMGSFFGDRKEVIARVDETEILQRDFQRMYGQQLESLRQRLGENADQIAQQVNLRQQVFQQLIDRQLLLNMAESLNLRATDLEVQEYIRQQPYFQKNGQFDFETYETLLSQNRLPTEDYEESIRLDLLLQKKQQLLTAGIIISERDVEQRFQLQNEKLEVRTLQLLPQVFLDEVSVSEEQAQQYYQENPDEFQTLPRYRLAYFILGINDLTKVEDVRERAIRRYYERNIETYTTPPEVRARHILLRVPGDANDEAKAERRQQLQEVRERIVAGAGFAKEAKEISQDMTKEKGGDLGWFKPGEMVPAFESAAFGLQPGEMSDIVESPFGLHLIKVEERREGGQQPIEEVREEIVAILKWRSGNWKKPEIPFGQLLVKNQLVTGLLSMGKLLRRVNGWIAAAHQTIWDPFKGWLNRPMSCSQKIMRCGLVILSKAMCFTRFRRSRIHKFDLLRKSVR